MKDSFYIIAYICFRLHQVVHRVFCWLVFPIVIYGCILSILLSYFCFRLHQVVQRVFCWLVLPIETERWREELDSQKCKYRVRTGLKST